MGLDPGLRTGVKVAVVDGTGKLVATQRQRVAPLKPNAFHAMDEKEAIRLNCSSVYAIGEEA
jgi:transcriptional accessory protein Tex/SPT6